VAIGFKEFTFKGKQQMVGDIPVVDSVPHLGAYHQWGSAFAALPFTFYHRDF
jgi:hypothetical protein